MDFTSELLLDDGVVEREFTLGEVPGILWTPGSGSGSEPESSGPAPLILIGHNGGLHKRLPRLVARARYFAAGHGFAAAAIDAPGTGTGHALPSTSSTALTCGARWRPVSRSVTSSMRSSCRWSSRRCRSGRPRSTPS